MYDNIGGKIKTLVKIIAYGSIVVFGIIGIATMFQSADSDAMLLNFFLGLLIFAIGVGATWLSTFILYGFGEIIELLTRINENCEYSAEMLNYIGTNQIDDYDSEVSDNDSKVVSSPVDVAVEWRCKKCGTKNEKGALYCKDCGTYK